MSQLLQRLNRQLDYGLLIALVIPLFAVIPLLLHAGLPNTADGPAHLMRQVELNQAWQQGSFYIRWGADLALGHGMPIFNYTPPLLYQATQLIHLTGLPLDASLKLVLALTFLLYSVGMFLFARRIFGPYPALVAAAIHVYAPYRLREAYIQGSYGQFIGLALYPVILWAFHGLITDGRHRYFVTAALSLAALLLSHNITALHFAPLLAAYLLFLFAFQFIKSNPANYQLSIPKGHFVINYQLRPLLRVTAAALLGLGLSAIYWLPALGERDLVQFEKITQGFFDFRHNFLTFAELIALPLPLDLTAINPEFPLSLGPAQLIAATAGIIAVIMMVLRITQPETQNPKPKTQLFHTLFFTIFFLIFTLLILPVSQPIWEIAPLLELTEFPWRMLGPAIFCASVLAAAAMSIINGQLAYLLSNHTQSYNFIAGIWRFGDFLLNLNPLISKSRQNSVATIDKLNSHQLVINNQKINLLIVNCSLLIVIFSNAYYLYPSQFIPWGTPSPADTFAYEVTTGAIGTNSAAEMLPRRVQQSPQPAALARDYQANRLPQKLDPATLPAGATAQTVSHLAESYTVQIDTPQPFEASLRTLYWPGWQPYLDGKPADFQITPNTGLIQTAIPAGQHTLTLQLESTPTRTTGLWLTLIALVALIALTLWKLLHSTNNQRQRTRDKGRGTNSQFSILNSQFSITAAILIAIYLISRPLAPLFTLRSDPNRPQPADRQLQVDFADQVRLVGADDLSQTVQLPGDGEATLNAVLYWRALQELDTNYAVFLHLDLPSGETVATVDEVNPDNIPTRNWPPGLYLRNALQLDIPADLPPIRYDLTAGVYNPQTGQRLPIQGSKATAFNLGSLWLSPPQPASMPAPIATFGPYITLHQASLDAGELTLLWQTAQPIAQNYSIFVHLLDEQGNLIGQADGVPFDGQYPLPNWRPGQLIEDSRQLDASRQPATLTIGIYDPVSGQRLPAIDADGQPLPNNSYLLPVSP